MDDDIRQRLDAAQHREAFELIVDRYQDKVFRLAVSMMRDEALAQDLVQEVLLKVWKALQGYNGEASLSTWIYTITRNTCLTELKKRSRHPTAPLEDPEIQALVDLQIADANTEPTLAHMDVDTMLEGLADKYRRVVTLFYLEERSYEEVAVLLDIPLGTVKTFLYRGKRELLKMHQTNERIRA